jgi:hypothetical protein
MTHYDGFYSILFRGTHDFGVGVIVLNNGAIVGADSGGVAYDGIFYEDPDRRRVVLKITATVPPGVELVQGIPAQPRPYTFKIEAAVPDDLRRGEASAAIQTPFGPVNVIFRRLRSLLPDSHG